MFGVLLGVQEICSLLHMPSDIPLSYRGVVRFRVSGCAFASSTEPRSKLPT